MNCTQCGQLNEKGKFCVKCGTPLLATTEQHTYSETAASNDSFRDTTVTSSSSARTTLQGHKKFLHCPMSQTAGTKLDRVMLPNKAFILANNTGGISSKALLHPFQTTQIVNSTHFTNGLITMFFTSLLFPFIFYISAKQTYFGSSISFGSGVIKPLIVILISLLLASLLTFAVIRLGRVACDYVTITAKLGTMLVPAVAALFLCLICIVLELSPNLIMIFLLIGLSVIFSSITAVVLSARKESISGLDPLYGAIIANLVYAYILVKFISFSMEAVLGNIFGGLNMFY